MRWIANQTNRCAPREGTGAALRSGVWGEQVKDVVMNLLGGVMLASRRPFKLGDRVKSGALSRRAFPPRCYPWGARGSSTTSHVAHVAS